MFYTGPSGSPLRARAGSELLEAWWLGRERGPARRLPASRQTLHLTPRLEPRDRQQPPSKRSWEKEPAGSKPELHPWVQTVLPGDLCLAAGGCTAS